MKRLYNNVQKMMKRAGRRRSAQTSRRAKVLGMELLEERQFLSGVPMSGLSVGGPGKNPTGDAAAAHHGKLDFTATPDGAARTREARAGTSAIGVLSAVEAKDGGFCVTGSQGAAWSGNGLSCIRTYLPRPLSDTRVGMTICSDDVTGEIVPLGDPPTENPCGDEGIGEGYAEEVTQTWVVGTIEREDGTIEPMFIPYEDVHCTLTEMGGGEQSQRGTGSSGGVENENEGYQGQGGTGDSQSGGEALASNDTAGNDNDDGDQQSDDWDPFSFPDPDGDDYGGPRARPDALDARCQAFANPADRLSLVAMPDPEGDGGPVGPNARATGLDGPLFAAVDTVMASVSAASAAHRAVLSTANPADRLSLVEMPNPDDDGGPVGPNARTAALSGGAFAASVDAVMASVAAGLASHQAIDSLANPADRLSLVEMPNPDDDGGPVGPNAKTSAIHGHTAVQHIAMATGLAACRAIR
jgi:hypothetical protein